jgi:Tfp pilus assembly protein PilO
MLPAETGERRTDLRSQVIDRLHDPMQLRIVVIGLIIAIGYFAVYTPLEEQITITDRRITREQKLGVLANKIEQLEGECNKFSKLLSHQSDKKEWLQYVLEGVRKMPVTLTNIDVTGSTKIGPYNVVIFKIEATGSYYDLDLFLRWFENNPRLFRVDSIDISVIGSDDNKKKNKDLMVMQLVVLGLGG